MTDHERRQALHRELAALSPEAPALVAELDAVYGRLLSREAERIAHLAGCLLMDANQHALWLLLYSRIFAGCRYQVGDEMRLLVERTDLLD